MCMRLLSQDTIILLRFLFTHLPFNYRLFHKNLGMLFVILALAQCTQEVLILLKNISKNPMTTITITLCLSYSTYAKSSIVWGKNYKLWCQIDVDLNPKFVPLFMSVNFGKSPNLTILDFLFS